MIEQNPQADLPRADPTGVPRALSDVLDDYLYRMHGITTSHNGWNVLLSLLHDEEHEIVDRRDDPLWADYQELDGWYWEAMTTLAKVARRVGYDVVTDPDDHRWNPGEVRELMARWAAG